MKKNRRVISAAVCIINCCNAYSYAVGSFCGQYGLGRREHGFVSE